MIVTLLILILLAIFVPDLLWLLLYAGFWLAVLALCLGVTLALFAVVFA